MFEVVESYQWIGSDNRKKAICVESSISRSLCHCLTAVQLSDSVETFGEYAFSGCTGIETVTISEKVSVIPNSAFFGCASLTTVSFGAEVARIGAFAFYGCSSLTEINYGGDAASYSKISVGVCNGAFTGTAVNYG